MDSTTRTRGGPIDPVCGQELSNKQARPSCRYKEHQYYFCGEECLVAFVRRAERMHLEELAAAGALMHTSGIRLGLC